MSRKDVEWIESDCDIRVRSEIYDAVNRREEIKLLTWKTAIADAVMHGMIGATPDKKNRNGGIYSRWFKRIQSRIKVLSGQKIATVWDKIDRSGRKSHRI